MSKMTESDFQRLCGGFVRKEVVCCVSELVSTLAGGANSISDLAGRDLVSLGEQAMELAVPVLDYEEAAIQAGHKLAADGKWTVYRKEQVTLAYDNAEELCAEENIDPYEREVFEHWAVTPWLADKLIERGEKVDKDFAGLCVWARTCTGQGIASDELFRQLTRERHGLDKKAEI